MKLYKKITTLTVSSFLLMSLSISQGKEKDLIKNGDFSKSKLKYWLVGVTAKYGHKIDPKVKQKSMQFDGIKGLAPKYITFGQYVQIEKGKSYRVSFEYQTAAEFNGKFSYNIGRPGFARPQRKKEGYDHVRRSLKPSAEWKKITDTFTGIYITDNKDYEGKKVKGAKLKKEWSEKEKSGLLPKAPTWIVFNIGAVTGKFHLRNVTLVEIADGELEKPKKEKNKNKDKDEKKEEENDKEDEKEEKKKKKGKKTAAERKAERERKKQERKAKRKKDKEKDE